MGTNKTVVGERHSQQSCEIERGSISSMDHGRIRKKDRHLNVALLQTALDAVKVGLVKVVVVFRRCWMSRDTLNIPDIMAGLV